MGSAAEPDWKPGTEAQQGPTVELLGKEAGALSGCLRVGNNNTVDCFKKQKTFSVELTSNDPILVFSIFK